MKVQKNKKIAKKKIQSKRVISPRDARLKVSLFVATQIIIRSWLFHFYLKLLVFLLIFFSFGLGIIYLVIQTNPAFAGTFADSVLRPLIGDKTTITLEAILFNIQDGSNQLQYSFVKKEKNVLAETSSRLSPTPLPSSSPSLNDKGFSLAKIPHLAFTDILVKEGFWSDILVGTQAGMLQKTFYRPDIDRPYAVATLIAMNMNKLAVSGVAGLKEPGGPTKPGSGRIPIEIQNSNQLVAAFNGGFQQKDGQYGMIADGITYLPLKQHMATLILSKNDTPKIIKYVGQKFGSDVLVVRQNAPLLLQDGYIVTSDADWTTQTWGLTTTNTMYTWRSGLGVTRDGTLVYASGPSLIPETLAGALQAAGAVNAMQLDINPSWVRFVLFDSLGLGQYKYVSLTPEMVNGGYQYLHGYQKDFFYVYKR